jgi:hypothetical protein
MPFSNSLRPHTIVASSVSPHAIVASNLRPHTIVARSVSPHTLVASSLRPHAIVASSLRPHEIVARSLRHHTLASSLNPHTLVASSVRPHTLVASRLRPHTLLAKMAVATYVWACARFLRHGLDALNITGRHKMITSMPKLPEMLYLQSSGVFQCLCGCVFVWWVMCVAFRDQLEFVADMYTLRHSDSIYTIMPCTSVRTNTLSKLQLFM